MALRSSRLPSRSVNLTDELVSFVLMKVKSGRYENASEVVRAALRNLEREEQRYEVKLTALLDAIDEGDTCGTVEGDVFPQIRDTLRLSSRT